MTVDWNLNEVWAGLREAWLGDTDLVPLLGAPDAIYRIWPNVSVTYPIMTFSGSTSAVGTSSAGLWRSSLQINAYAADPRDCERILGTLERNWGIPITRPQPLIFTNFRVTQIKFGTRREVGRIKVTDSDQWILHHLIEAQVRFSLRSGVTG